MYSASAILYTMLLALFIGFLTKQLQNRFRNVRRKLREHLWTNFCSTCQEKRSSSSHHDVVYCNNQLLDELTYQDHTKQLTRQLSKPIKNKAAIISLVAEMAPNRRQWILAKGPRISEVTNKFPSLEEYDMVCLLCYCRMCSYN